MSHQESLFGPEKVDQPINLDDIARNIGEVASRRPVREYDDRTSDAALDQGWGPVSRVRNMPEDSPRVDDSTEEEQIEKMTPEEAIAAARVILPPVVKRRGLDPHRQDTRIYTESRARKGRR